MYILLLVEHSSASVSDIIHSHFQCFVVKVIHGRPIDAIRRTMGVVGVVLGNAARALLNLFEQTLSGRLGDSHQSFLPPNSCWRHTSKRSAGVAYHCTQRIQ